ncbi:MAG: CarD family transcriptional regulator [Polyangiaceae bacterium]|nr:CarD family transcriptional regulator [Polyangiaceae bacterium]
MLNAIEEEISAGMGLDLKEGDLAVHPSHGVGIVSGVEEREIAGLLTEVYVLDIKANDLRVMVPKLAAARVGLRTIMTEEEADEILIELAKPEVAVSIQPWNRRFRAYTEMVTSGSAIEVARVLRDMCRLRYDKDLSFGERRLLEQAKSLLEQELAIAKDLELSVIEARITDTLAG